MAYYSYKRARDAVPPRVMTTDYYRAAFCGGCKGFCAAQCEYDGDANYDGDMWSVTADYITRLRQAADAVCADPSEANRAALRLALDGALPPSGSSGQP